MDKGLLMPVNHLLTTDLEGTFARANGYRLDGWCQSLFELSLNICWQIRTFIKCHTSSSQLHSKGKTGGKATLTAILFASVGKPLYNVSSF